MPPQANGERPKKLQRISQACDLCHRRSIRCRPSAENPQQQCQNCYDFAVDCTYNRPSRRRRNPSGADAPAQDPPSGKQSHQHRHAAAPLQPSSVSPTTVDSDLVPPAQQEPSHRPKPSQAVSDLTGAYATIREDRPSDPLATAWRSFALASADAINEYVHIYMEVIYPVYPVRPLIYCHASHLVLIHHPAAVSRANSLGTHQTKGPHQGPRLLRRHHGGVCTRLGQST